MKILLKSFQYAVLALILFTSLAYAQTSKLPIRIAWQPDPNVPYYLASSRQFFEEAGLAPEHIKFLAAPLCLLHYKVLVLILLTWVLVQQLLLKAKV